MNKKALIIAFAVIIIGATSCLTTKKAIQPAASVFPLTDTVTLRNGTLVYALPRTVITVEAEFERTIEIPGPYAAFAGDLLGLNDVIKSQGEYWSVKGLAVKTHQEIDPLNYYVIRTASVFRSDMLSLRNEGLILDASYEMPGFSGVGAFDKTLGSGILPFVDLGSDEYYIAQNDTAYRRVALDSSFVRIPYVVEKKKRLTNAQLAERAAKRLMELREGKIMIMTGEANVYPQNEAAIAELNKMIKDYTELFTGKKITQTRKYTCQVIPQKDQSASPLTLFRFSDQTGPEEISSKSGIPVTMSITSEQKTREISGIASPVANRGNSGNLVYRIPDFATAKINLGNETLHTSRLMIYQLGELVELPGNYLIGR